MGAPGARRRWPQEPPDCGYRPPGRRAFTLSSHFRRRTHPVARTAAREVVNEQPDSWIKQIACAGNYETHRGEAYKCTNLDQGRSLADEWPAALSKVSDSIAARLSALAICQSGERQQARIRNEDAQSKADELTKLVPNIATCLPSPSNATYWHTDQSTMGQEEPPRPTLADGALKRRHWSCVSGAQTSRGTQCWKRPNWSQVFQR